MLYSREYTRVYTGLYHHFYMANVYILKERNSISCSFVGAESYRGEAYTKGGKDIFLWENLVLLCFTLCFFSHCFMVLWVTFNIYALLLSSHHVYVLGMHTSLCHCDCMFRWSFALPYDHCSNFHMTVMYLIKLLIYFTSCLLYCIFTCYIILVILLLALPWRSNVFCASILGYRYICSKFITCFRFRCE